MRVRRRPSPSGDRLAGRRRRALVGALVAAVFLVGFGLPATTAGGQDARPPSSAPVARVPGADSPTLVAPASGTPGIDVSAYQHGVDWKKVVAAGARFAYVKATEGTYYTNARLTEQYTGAAAAGLVRGAFHFAAPNQSSGLDQAEFYVQSLARLGGGRVDGSSTLPPLLDLESDPYTARDGTNICWGLTPKQMVTWIAAFSDTVIAFTGRVPMIYTTTRWWDICTGSSDAFANNPLYLARYVTDATSGPGALPAGWSRVTMWQYTNVGSRYAGVTDGSRGDTAASDEDVFAGSTAALRAFARGSFADSTGLAAPHPGVPLPL